MPELKNRRKKHAGYPSQNLCFNKNGLCINHFVIRYSLKVAGMKKIPHYGIDGPEAIIQLLISALFTFISTFCFYYFVYQKQYSFMHYFLYAFFWSSFLLLSIVMMLFSSLVGKYKVVKKIVQSLQLKGSEIILDVGCGRGLFLNSCAKKLTSGYAVGLDIWSQTDQTANRPENTLNNAKIEGVLNKIKLITGDMKTIPFNDNTFDVVVSSLALHNLPTKEARAMALSEMVRVLKTDGRIVLLDFMYLKQYQSVLEQLGIGHIALSKRIFWQYPPVRWITGYYGSQKLRT